MFSEIEEKILIRLKEKGLQVRGLEIKKDPKGNVAPAVFAHIDEGTFKKVSQSTFKIDISVFLTIAFKKLKAEDSRRKGLYPLLLAVINYLTLQNLELKNTDGSNKIDPLQPVRFQNVTTEADLASGLLLFQIQFRTGFYIEKVEDEVAGELLRIGLEYYLKPGDDVLDAQDIMELKT